MENKILTCIRNGAIITSEKIYEVNDELQRNPQLLKNNDFIHSMMDAYTATLLALSGNIKNESYIYRILNIMEDYPVFSNNNRIYDNIFISVRNLFEEEKIEEISLIMQKFPHILENNLYRKEINERIAILINKLFNEQKSNKILYIAKNADLLLNENTNKLFVNNVILLINTLLNNNENNINNYLVQDLINNVPSIMISKENRNNLVNLLLRNNSLNTENNANIIISNILKYSNENHAEFTFLPEISRIISSFINRNEEEANEKIDNFINHTMFLPNSITTLINKIEKNENIINRITQTTFVNTFENKLTRRLERIIECINNKLAINEHIIKQH